MPSWKTAEVWRQVVGFEPNYEVSDLGRVRRAATHNLIRRRGMTKMMRSNKVGIRGYHQVHLTRDGKSVMKLVHRLVLEAFLGPCPKGMESSHIDDDPDNNGLDNLLWETPPDNCRRRKSRLPNVPRRRLTEEDVRQIKALRGKISNVQIASRFGVHDTTINAIFQGRTWVSV